MQTPLKLKVNTSKTNCVFFKESEIRFHENCVKEGYSFEMKNSINLADAVFDNKLSSPKYFEIF